MGSAEGASAATETYKSMLPDTMADALISGGGIGLASDLVRATAAADHVHVEHAGDLLALHVDRADVIGLEKTLADAGGGAQHAVRADPDRVVALVARAEALQPDALADLAHLLLELELGNASRAVAVASVSAVSHERLTFRF